MLPSNLEGWLDYIARQHSHVIDLGLDRVAQVLARMQVSPAALGTVITVAGTNGKGSTVATLEYLLRAQGFRVCTYTSPHLLRYNERVRIDGVDAEDALLCAGFAAVERARGDVALTYFEFGTLAALKCFADQTPDFTILEVGLGGRLDAVNVIDSDLAVVTSIGIDHVDWLGPDRESIGREKAGIMRAGAPCVCGDASPPESLLQHALQLPCALFIRGRQFDVEIGEEDRWHWSGTGEDARPLVCRDLPMVHVPIQNVATALQALLILNRLPDEQQLRSLLPNIRVPGRFQQVSAQPTVILDVGHNPDAAAYLRDRISRIGGRWLAVFSALTDKDITGVSATLADVVAQWYCAPLAVERGASREQLQSSLAAANLHSIHWSNGIVEAFTAALEDAQPDDHILVFGSFHTVESIMRCLGRASINQLNMQSYS